MTTAPLSNLTATWNASGTTFTAVKMNVTDTASAAASLLLDLQVGGVSKLSVSKDGSISSAADILAKSNTAGLYIGSSSDVVLLRDSANALAQRRSTNTQSSRIYSTYTNSTNYQRMTLTSARVALSGLSGASATATTLIPKGAVVVGVTSRVTTLLAGASGYLIGTAGDTDRWGDITGTAVGTTSDNRDWTAGTIECFTADTDVVITAKTSNFTVGAIEIAVHYLAGEAD